MSCTSTVSHVVVIGGGMSGLAAAERLSASASPLRVTLIEASERLGGIVSTERVDGFVIERGPDVVLATKPAVRALCERLGIAHRLHGTAVRGAYVARGARLVRLPEGLSGLVPTRLGPLARSGLLSLGGLLRVCTEPLRARSRDGDESVESFMTRRLGREMYERIAEPMLTGIYAGHGARLSMAATFPQLLAGEREHGSLLRGLRPPRGAARPSSPFLSLPTGLGELPEAVEAALASNDRVTIRRGTTAIAVHAHDGGARITLGDGTAIDGDAVIVATPAPVAAALLRDVDATLAGELSSIELGSTATVTLAYAAAEIPRPLDATGYVVPRVERRPVLACTWASSKLPGRAPAGMALLRVFVGGAQRPELVDATDDELLAVARDELRTTLGVTATPRLVRVGRWRRAMPQYHLGHGERVARIERRVEALPWLALAGNAYRGVGVPDVIASGERAAARVLAPLRTSAEAAAAAAT